MPHFYLHIRNGAGYDEDPEGQELADLDAARLAAIDGVRSVLSEEMRQGQVDLTGAIEIADGDGNVLLIVHFRDAVQLKLDGRIA
jgi:hypothetical protein